MHTYTKAPEYAFFKFAIKGRAMRAIQNLNGNEIMGHKNFSECSKI